MINMKWLDNIPLVFLVPAALLLGLAPFGGEPHLIEKINMLLDGTLAKPIDIFDLLMHATPSLLLIVRIARVVLKSSNSDD